MTKLGIIGGGVMGEAILAGLLGKEFIPSNQIVVSEPQSSRREMLEQKYGIHLTSDNGEVMASEVVLLAIKPQMLEPVVSKLPQEHKPLIISILAGVSISRLESFLPLCPIVRAMPNTPATIGAGVTAICGGQWATSLHIEFASSLFNTIGTVVQVQEYLMNGITGLSGSGPAYVAIMIEALADGGVRVGLPRVVAQQLAIQTVLGTAQLLKDSGMHPAQLKDQVTSPGGTTIAGIAALEEEGFRWSLIKAVQAATIRAEELGN